jgi:hypothetical protein
MTSYFNISGGLPYLGTSITTVYLAHSAQLAATGVVTNIDPGVALTILDQALNIQVTYGAVMLSFLGQRLPYFMALYELMFWNGL